MPGGSGGKDSAVGVLDSEGCLSCPAGVSMSPNPTLVKQCNTPSAMVVVLVEMQCLHEEC